MQQVAADWEERAARWRPGVQLRNTGQRSWRTRSLPARQQIVLRPWFRCL